MQILNPAAVAKPGAGYAQGVAAGGAIYVAGQVAIDAAGAIVGRGDLVAQTRQTLANVANVLAAGGMSLGDVVSTTVYLSDLTRYRAFCETWCEVFGEHTPARATVKADLVHPDLLVEIQAIAVRNAAASA
ncbi:MAG: RidA family protein [Caulobacterales bacterium]